MNNQQNQPVPSDRPSRQTRTQRRLQHTRTSIEDAFITLVSERGYHNVSVEAVAERADVAKATFYAHFDNKVALLEAVFARLTRELTERMAPQITPHARIRSEITEAFFQQAGQLRDLFRVCLEHGRTRSQYQAYIADVVEHAFVARVQAKGTIPRAPARAAALAYAGAHLALLEGWLDGTLTETPDRMAALDLALTVPGQLWALGEEIPEIEPAQPHKDNPRSPAPER